MRKAFTLVELSIVLIIIGILIGGVLKGKEMIENAKLKRVKSDIDGITAAISAYQDRYGALPGDDNNNREDFAPGCDGSQGNSNGYFDSSEEVCLWKELYGSNLLKGDKTESDINLLRPKNPYGGVYKINYDLNPVGHSEADYTNWVFIHGIGSRKAQALDRIYDDGKFDSGMIITEKDYTKVEKGRKITILWGIM